MLFDFANVAVFLLFGIGFVLANLILAKILAPKAPTFEKSIPYECGETPEGTPWIRFNSRYYFFALIFLIFDVEVAFMYPVATVFRSWVKAGLGQVAFIEIFAFVGTLVVGLAYVWKKGYLEWIRNLSTTSERGRRAPITTREIRKVA